MLKRGAPKKTVPAVGAAVGAAAAGPSDEETIVSVLSRHVKERPHHQIFRWVDNKARVTSTMTYKQLWDQSMAVQKLLENRGVKRGDRVMIAYPFGLEFLAGLVGCMMAGVVGCSVYPPNPQRLQADLPAFHQKVEDAQAIFALTTSSLRRFMILNHFIGNRSSITWIATDSLRPVRDTQDTFSQNIGPDDVAFVQYTSGSTGFPKGVIISHRSLVTNTFNCAAVSNATSETKDFTAVSWMPQYHDMGLIGFFFTVIYAGVTGVVCSPLDFILQPTLWHDMVIKYRANTTLGPNFSYGLLIKRLMARSNKAPLSDTAKKGNGIESWSFVDRVICAAEPVDPVVMNQVISVLGVEPSSLHVGYGLAEVGLAACFTPFQIMRGLVACGDVVGQSTIRIVDEEKKALPNGTVGEIYVHSPNLVALGYWGKPELSNATFSNLIPGEEGDWLATGDLGVVMENKLFVTGRSKEVIIINGLNYFPTDLERTIEKSYPTVVRPGCVVAYQHSDGAIGIAAELRKGFNQEDCPKGFEVVGAIARENQAPVEYVCLLRDHTIPKTTSGKLKRTEVKLKSLERTWASTSIISEWHKPVPLTDSTQRKNSKTILRSRMSTTGMALSNDAAAAAALSSSGDDDLSDSSDATDEEYFDAVTEDPVASARLAPVPPTQHISKGSSSLGRQNSLGSSLGGKRPRRQSFLQREFMVHGITSSDEFATEELLEEVSQESSLDSSDRSDFNRRNGGLGSGRRLSLMKRQEISDRSILEDTETVRELVDESRRNLMADISDGTGLSIPFLKGDSFRVEEEPDTIMMSKGTRPQTDEIPPSLGSKYGTQCPFAGQGLQAFYQKQKSAPYSHGMTIERATIGTKAIVAALGNMERNLDNGRIKREYELAEHIFADNRYWTAVPGFQPKQFALAQDAAVHKEYLPWLVSKFCGLPDLESLRGGLKQYLSGKGNALSIDDVRKWVLMTFFEVFADKKMSDKELNDFMTFQSKVLDMVMRPTPDAAIDESVLNQKASYLRELVSRMHINDDKASAVLDMLVFASMNLTSGIHVSLALLFCNNEYFDRNDFAVNDQNVKQFVWESLRLFPPQSSVGWREHGVRHVAVIGITGLDKALWGQDVTSFRPDRCTVEEYESRSSLFAEQAGNYRCPARQFAVDAMSAMLLEVADHGSWYCPAKVKTYRSAPYFDNFVLKQLPRAIIIGAGASGLMCALKLARQGVRVTLIEKNESIGGHARHTEVFGGHLRNPAFGAFVDGLYPNLVDLIDELGLEKVRLCHSRDFRQNLAFDGNEIPKADPAEVARFLAGMKRIHETGKDGLQSIGDYLDANRFDEKFILYFFLGKAIHFFAGLSTAEYLEIPLPLMAWFMVADMAESNSDVFRLRNKDYMEAFADALKVNGVEILTGTAAELVSRNSTGVCVAVENGRVLDAEKLVLAIPPNAIVNFLANHLSSHERRLKEFDCRYETVILHQDPRWVSTSQDGALFGLMPNQDDPWPSKQHTIPLTTSTFSDTDAKTLIYCTHAYANYKTLKIQGPKEEIAFTHVRINRQTSDQRKELLAYQGKSSTYFAGGWTRGFMLHEDALVSGMNVANAILSLYGLPPCHIAKRKVELSPTRSSISIEDGSERSNTAQDQITEMVSPRSSNLIRKSAASSAYKSKRSSASSSIKVVEMQLEASKRREAVRQSVEQSFRSQLSNEIGHIVNLGDKVGSLGMTSLNISSVHSALQEKLSLSDDALPVSAFFEGERTIEDIVSSAVAFSLIGADEEEITHASKTLRDMIVDIWEEEMGGEVYLSDRLGELGMESMHIASLQASLSTLFDDPIPISWFFDAELTVGDLISRIEAFGPEDTTVPRGEAAQHEHVKQRHPHVQPLLEVFAARLLQLLAIVFQSAFLALSIFPSILTTVLLFERLEITVAIVLAPVSFYVYALTAAMLLVVVKWTLVGRQQEGHTSIWSSKFAARWVVRQCSQLVWEFTIWRLWGDTEVMNVLHRLLGCRVGSGAKIEPGCIHDYDLVSVGMRSSVKSGVFINTETVSLGVQTLGAVTIGSDCVIEVESMIERGSSLSDNVTLRQRTKVPPFSVLPQATSWRGKPAELIEERDMDYAGLEGEDIEMGCPQEGSTKSIPSRIFSPYHVMHYLTLFVVAPYLLTFSFGILFLVGSSLYEVLGKLGLGALIWVPPTTVWILNLSLGILAKWVLLGVVKPGVWPVHGSFHTRQFFVGHIIEDHSLYWRSLAQASGSFLAWSPTMERGCLRCLGVKLGQLTTISASRAWTSYELLSLGRNVLWAVRSEVFPWKTSKASLIAGKISVGDDCYAGAYSHIMGGVDLGYGATVAGYSGACQSAGEKQTVIGSTVYNTTLEASETVEWSILRREQANVIGSLAIWAGVCAFTLALFTFIESSGYASAASLVDPVFLASLVFGLVVGLGIPIMVIAMLIVAKILIVWDRNKVSESRNGSLQNLPQQSFEGVLLGPLIHYVWQAFRGTDIEVFFWVAMGAKVGANAYFDGIIMWEADLVTIGNSCSIGPNARLTAHQITRSMHVYHPIIVGDRCTIGANSCIHGRDILEDDTVLEGGSMLLKGSKLKSGVWRGYPAKRIGDAPECHKPSDPAWTVLLFHPLSLLPGSLWLLKWNFRSCCGFKRKRKFSKQLEDVFESDLPGEFIGSFGSHDSLLDLRYDSAEWSPDLRVLKLAAGSYMVAKQLNDQYWWDNASYEFVFQGSELKQADGWVHLGWWKVPLSIISAKLRRDGDEWIWSHSWFNGDPNESVRFARIVPTPVTQGRDHEAVAGWSWPTFISVSSTVTHEYVTVGDGQLRMHCVLAGSGSETPVLLLHGFPEVSYSWATHIDRLAQSGRRRFLIPDLRGFGETDFVGDPEEWSVPTTVEDLIELLDYYHIDKVILIGHDYGAITAWAMQKLHPNRVAAVASIGFADIALEQIGGEPEYPGQPPTERVTRSRTRGEDSPVSYVLDFANIARKSEGIVSRNAIIGLYQLENSTMLASAKTPRDDNVLPPDLLLVLDKCSVVNPISRQLTVHKNVDISYAALEPVLNDPTVYPDLPVLVIGCGKDKAWTPELVESAQIPMRYPQVEIRREDAFFHYCLNQRGAKDRLRDILGDWVDSLEF